MKSYFTGLFLILLLGLPAHAAITNQQTSATYPSIQAALNAASANQTILLDAGTYYENLSWPNTDNITLRGATGTNSANVIIDGNRVSRCITVEHPVSISICAITIQQGVVSGNGGGIYLGDNSFCNLFDCILQACTANTDYPIRGFGGAMYVTCSAIVTINTCSFLNNCANNGAGISNFGKISCRDTNFQANYTSGFYFQFGGAIENNWGSTYQGDHNRFINNYGQIGGAIDNDGRYIEDKSLYENNTSYQGGAINSYSFSAKCQGNNNIFNNNKSINGYGGALFISDSTYNGDNNIFSNNSAYYGGAIYINNSTPTLSVYIGNNNIFYSNQADYEGGAIFLGGINPNSILYKGCNNIYWNNRSITSYGPQIAYYYNTITDITYSCIQDNGTYYQDGLSITDPNSHNVSADPKFIDPQNGDFHLQSHSPCIDSGTENVSLNYDLDGIFRPQYTAYDIGVYENHSFTTFKRIPVENSYCTINSPVQFYIGDTPNGVDISQVKVNIKGQLFDQTSPQFSYAGTSTSYSITIVPPAFDPNGDVVGITIDAKDTLGNPMVVATYSIYVDGTAPTINLIKPLDKAVQVVVETPIIFDIFDNETGISLSTLIVTINGAPAIVSGSGFAPTFNNIIMTPTLNNNGYKGYHVSVTPNSNFPANSTISITVQAKNNMGMTTKTDFSFQTFTYSSKKVHNISYSPTRDYYLIQEALDDARKGDIILVEPGIYIQKLIWPNTTNITLCGVSSAVSNSVIIDADMTGRAISILHAVQATINNLTIENGYLASGWGGLEFNGAAVFITSNASVYFNDVIISGNAVGGANAMGSGIYIYSNGSCKTYNCLFSQNQGKWGAAVTNYGTYTGHFNIFQNNSGSSGCIYNISNYYGNHNLFTNNSNSGAVIINYNPPAYYAGHNNIFRDNSTRCVENGWGYYEGDGNLFINNSGGGVSNLGRYHGSNNTFYHNSNTLSGGAIFSNNQYYGKNNIFYENSAPTGSHLYVSGIVSLSYSCITSINSTSVVGITLNCDASDHNFDKDPMFTNTTNYDLSLQSGSPCIDTGTNNYWAIDVTGKARPQGFAFDRGAYEYPGFASSSLSQPSLATNLAPLAYPTVFNPDNGTTSLYFNLKSNVVGRNRVKLRIYNLSSECIWEYEPPIIQVGSNSVPWNGKDGFSNDLANGVYIFYVLDGSTVVGKGKVVIIR